MFDKCNVTVRSGVNVASKKAVTGSSVYKNDQTYGFYRVTDGPTNNGFRAQTGESSWLMIDLVNLYLVVRVTLLNLGTVEDGNPMYIVFDAAY